MSETPLLRAPTVYFIDDSATMREVIKIAFRRENINVVTCADAVSALEQFRQTAPDAVISDVIMPDKDGYEICQFIKHNPELSRTPVILMSGVVNRAVAEKAMAAQADELIRKPFQPQELIARVKKLLHLEPTPGIADVKVANPLSRLFATSVPEAAPAPAAAAPRAPANGHATAATLVPPPPKPQSAAAELVKLRNELRRLELLVKKLQAELEAQREYSAALEVHIKALEESE